MPYMDALLSWLTLLKIDTRPYIHVPGEAIPPDQRPRPFVQRSPAPCTAARIIRTLVLGMVHMKRGNSMRVELRARGGGGEPHGLNGDAPRLDRPARYDWAFAAGGALLLPLRRGRRACTLFDNTPYMPIMFGGVF